MKTDIFNRVLQVQERGIWHGTGGLAVERFGRVAPRRTGAVGLERRRDWSPPVGVGRTRSVNDSAAASMNEPVNGARSTLRSRISLAPPTPLHSRVSLAHSRARGPVVPRGGRGEVRF